jgi:hypothetical protein
MSQILSIYRVPAAHFEQIQKANHWEAVTSVATGEIGFQGSEPAIEYLLSKAGIAEDLASALIYPSIELTQGQYVHDIDFDAMDEDELFEYYSNALTYTSLETVNLLWQKIQPISVEQIGAMYNSLELREKNLGSWHDNESEDHAYNRRHITQDYQALREFYEAASRAGEYVFCLGV